MPFFKKIYTFLILAVATSLNTWGQEKAIGQWQSYLPYNKAQSVASNGSVLYVACESSFFTYDLLNKETTTYAKENGMADIELSYIAHDNLSEYTVLAYTNSNIDLFKDQTFYNIPDIKLKNVTSNKTINHILINDAKAYLSTGIGIIVIDLERKEVKETYVFAKGATNFTVKGLATATNYFYAITDNGLYQIQKNDPKIQASSSWLLLDSARRYTNVSMLQNKIYLSTSDSVFQWQGDTAQYIFSRAGKQIQHLDALENELSILTYTSASNSGNAFIMRISDNVIKDSIQSDSPKQSVQTSDGTIWIADSQKGILSKTENLVPNGPQDIGTYDIIAENGTLYIAHGSYDDKWNAAYPPNRNGISIYKDNSWKSYNIFNFNPFEKLNDAVRIAKDPKDQTVYIASQQEGLFYLKTDNTAGQLKEGIFEPHIIDPSTYRLSGVAFDSDNNLWVTQTNSPNELVARSAKDGNWYKFALPLTRPRPFWSNGAAGLIIDDINQKWFFSPVGGGVLVYNDNGTLENPNDDSYIRLINGKGQGNLPDNNVQCIVNDKKGTIWIGTSNGIGIINCPDRVTFAECEAEIRVVQYDQFAGELFAGENVKTIAVDGANRKWIGTGNGVWLISEDANTIIERFTKDNSPLPSNVIQTIKVDQVTGNVLIGTDKGMVSYRSTATEGGIANKDVLIFPNPVTKNYRGTIAIKGLVNNADVRITDISGQLVFKTKALGGQAIWNGQDYNGRRPQTGVFLVFATNNDGTETYAGKLVFVN
ncbi:MAG: T9SS type A sorting domain-containing protein [Chitinophagaceae bacterium]|nr:T9SS type A sorting domain-containing protein [Chitinophagaceae bacterium]